MFLDLCFPKYRSITSFNNFKVVAHVLSFFHHRPIYICETLGISVQKVNLFSGIVSLVITEGITFTNHNNYKEFSNKDSERAIIQSEVSMA